MLNQKGFTPILFLTAVLVLSAIIIAGIIATKKTELAPNSTAPTIPPIRIVTPTPNLTPLKKPSASTYTPCQIESPQPVPSVADSINSNIGIMPTPIKNLPSWVSTPLPLSGITIKKLVPDSGPAGTIVKIYGIGFGPGCRSPKGEVVGGSSIYFSPVADDGYRYSFTDHWMGSDITASDGTISFQIPKTITQSVSCGGGKGSVVAQNCSATIISIPAGTYYVAVTSKTGASKLLPFKVTSN